MKNIPILLIALFLTASALAQSTSVAGLYPTKGSGRSVYDFNQGGRFHLGEAAGAEMTSFDDTDWEVVNTPHTSRLEPAYASGCRNYQGVTWYRKHFTAPKETKGQRLYVHFEAIMGKQWVYVNGNLVKEHLGGYLPITIDLGAQGVKAGDRCLIAVKADNSDDKTYPPGKKQSALDFAYHGGIYRDVWLIGKNDVAITDAIEANRVAGGGVFVHYGDIREAKAELFVDVEVDNASGLSANPTIQALVKDKAGHVVATLRKKTTVLPKAFSKVSLSTTIKEPHLWSPEDPYLYSVEITVMSGKTAVDGGMVRTGIRKAEFLGENGFYLNGKPYGQLIGGNRHQDFAYVGNAVPNSQQWRDAKRLKEAGMNIIRAAHYPQDPSFMDACDELGIFIIVPTPGWQYWNKDPEFAKKVHENTRQIIRRDRNHTCVLMWEPILNETRYPKDFALEALQITKEEFPFPGRPVAAADLHSDGVKENYDVLYDWPENIGKDYIPKDKCIFTREFGEMVDDWYAHNCLNRAARAWGERPMLTAAMSLADTYATMFKGQRQFIGGCQWHPFDHQRGYHPDAYLGGIYDAFRQTKYAFYMFRSQISADKSSPMIFFANEMTQFSDNDVVIFSNCDSVRLTAFEGDVVQTLPVVHTEDGLQNAPLVFKGFWDFWKGREYSYKQRNWQKVSLMAEGFVGGKVVCTEKKMPSRRSTKLRLVADTMGKNLVADGNVRRLALEDIYFEVSGEGSIVGDAEIQANPRRTEWGTAPILVRSTNKAGKITITARPFADGTHAPSADTLVIESVSPELPACFEDYQTKSVSQSVRTSEPSNKMSEDERRRTLEEVEKQQKDFGTQQ